MPKSPGENLVLDELYLAVSILDQRDIDFAVMNLTERRNAVRQAMLPIKREINKQEGEILYPEAVDCGTTA